MLIGSFSLYTDCELNSAVLADVLMVCLFCAKTRLCNCIRVCLCKCEGREICIEPHPWSAQVWITQFLPCKYTTPACPHDRTKTVETTITKLIITSAGYPFNIRSKGHKVKNIFQLKAIEWPDVSSPYESVSTWLWQSGTD